MRVVPRPAASAPEPRRKLRRRILTAFTSTASGSALNRAGPRIVSSRAIFYGTEGRVGAAWNAAAGIRGSAGLQGLGHRGLGQGLEHFEQEVVFASPVSVSVEVQDEPMTQGRKSQLPHIVRADVQPPLHQRPDAPA